MIVISFEGLKKSSTFTKYVGFSSKLKLAMGRVRFCIQALFEENYVVLPSLNKFF